MLTEQFFQCAVNRLSAAVTTEFTHKFAARSEVPRDIAQQRFLFIGVNPMEDSVREYGIRRRVQLEAECVRLLEGNVGIFFPRDLQHGRRGIDAHHLVAQRLKSVGQAAIAAA